MPRWSLGSARKIRQIEKQSKVEVAVHSSLHQCARKLFEGKQPAQYRSIAAAIGRVALFNLTEPNWKTKRSAYGYIFEFEMEGLDEAAAKKGEKTSDMASLKIQLRSVCKINKETGTLLSTHSSLHSCARAMFPDKTAGAHRSISAAIGRCAKHNASVTNWKDKRTAYNFVFEYEGQMHGYSTTPSFPATAGQVDVGPPSMHPPSMTPHGMSVHATAHAMSTHSMSAHSMSAIAASTIASSPMSSAMASGIPASITASMMPTMVPPSLGQHLPQHTPQHAPQHTPQHAPQQHGVSTSSAVRVPQLVVRPPTAIKPTLGKPMAGKIRTTAPQPPQPSTMQAAAQLAAAQGLGHQYTLAAMAPPTVAVPPAPTSHHQPPSMQTYMQNMQSFM